MKFSSIIGVLATCTAVLAGPIYQRDLPSLFNLSNSTGGAVWNTSNHSNNSNFSNGTLPGEPEAKLKVYITGGYYDISTNDSDYEDVEFTTLFNSSSALNITQLYNISSLISDTLEDDSYYGVVIVTNAASIEPLAFFSSIVFDTDKAFVISEGVYSGVWVAMDPDSEERGPVTVGYETGLIYPGITATPIGITTIDGVAWFLDASKPELVGEYSGIRYAYPNFTSTDVDLSSAPLVPIIYDGDYSPSLINSLSSSLDGLIVVVSSLATNVTSSTLESDTFPVVYAQSGPSLSYLAYEDVPENAIAAGYLTPIQAQLLVSISIVNNVTDPSTINTLFP